MSNCNATSDESDQNPPANPAGRTLAEFEKLGPAEERLLHAVKVAEPAEIADKRPKKKTPDNTVRASFIRFLALGGDCSAPVHEHGIDLEGAYITGSLNLEGCQIKGGLRLRRCTLPSTLRFSDSAFCGLLDLSGSRVRRFQGDRLKSESSVFLRKSFTSTGEISFVGARIGGNFDCSDSVFQNHDDDALYADNIVVVGDVFLRGTFKATGSVRLLGANIQGDLDCTGGIFQNQDGDALSFARAEIGGNVFMADKFRATGEVSLIGAKIHGDLNCSGGTFQNQDQNAITANRVEVGGSVEMGYKFKATGRVVLHGAHITDSWRCSGGTFQNQNKTAISASRLEVGGNLYVNDESVTVGRVNFRAADIKGDLSFVDGYFSNDDDAIFLQGAKISGALMMYRATIANGIIDLTAAKIGRLIDDEHSWRGGVHLNGFIYGSIGGKAPTDARMRIGWLDQQAKAHSGMEGDGSEFRPQPWQQLRKVLREMGHYEAARQIGIEFETRKRRCGLVGGTREELPGWLPAWWWLTWLWPFYRGVYRITAKRLHWGYGFIVDYGYRPLKLVFWALLIWGVCASWFFFAARYEGVFVPREAAIYQKKYEAVCGPPNHVRWTDCKAIQKEYSLFYPAVYSLNVLLPVGNLGQEKAWRPMTTELPGIITQVAVWFETLFGWGASLILVAVVSGLAKRDE